MKTMTAVLFALGATLAAPAQIHTQTVVYKQGDTTLEGFLAYDTAIKGKRPGVLIVHQWKGLGDYERKRAEMLAKLGYTVFAVDIYGQGVRADNPKDAAALAGKYKEDRALLRARINAALDFLRKQERVNPQQIAAIG